MVPNNLTEVLFKTYMQHATNICKINSLSIYTHIYELEIARQDAFKIQTSVLHNNEHERMIIPFYYSSSNP